MLQPISKAKYPSITEVRLYFINMHRILYAISLTSGLYLGRRKAVASITNFVRGYIRRHPCSYDEYSYHTKYLATFEEDHGRITDKKESTQHIKNT